MISNNQVPDRNYSVSSNKENCHCVSMKSLSNTWDSVVKRIEEVSNAGIREANEQHIFSGRFEDSFIGNAKGIFNTIFTPSFYISGVVEELTGKNFLLKSFDNLGKKEEYKR